MPGCVGIADVGFVETSTGIGAVIGRGKGMELVQLAMLETTVTLRVVGPPRSIGGTSAVSWVGEL